METIAVAQDPQQTNSSTNSSQTTTVHGVVRNDVSGSPLPRVLVRINGDAATGALTDGDGRFEIADVPVGPQEFTVMKPGYLDALEATADSIAWNAHGYGHNVVVTSGMGDVAFTMRPVNSIVGRVQLSTGDAADGIQVVILKRTVQLGRAVWQATSSDKTSSSGMYRFGELPDGLYAVFTQPFMDNDNTPEPVEKGSANNIVRQGFASVFYPDARDLNSAAKIRLEGGEQAQANISLALEPFQQVVVNVGTPGRRGGDQGLAIQILDAQGHQLPYPAQYDAATHTVQTMLPDGAYSLLATRLPNSLRIATARNDSSPPLSALDSHPVTGEVSFAVAGRPVSNLRLPMAISGTSPVQISVTHDPNSTAQSQGETRVFVTLSQAGGWMSDGIVSSYAEGSLPGPLESTGVPPGSYWAHTSISSSSLCEGSFTAGGVSLAREPLVLGIGGSTAPMVLALRDDCAKLTLILPPSVLMTAGIERFFTVYVVPDFDSTADIVPQTLRLSTGGRITIGGLAPGSYHIYTFNRPVALEYRNAAALREFPAQAITLSPNAEEQLTLEAGQP